MFGITSAKLEVGMTIDKINNSSASGNVKKKQIELFNKYNTTPDDKIDEKEFAQYEKDCTKQKWITAGLVVGGTILAGVAGFTLWKYLKNAKNIANAMKDATQISVAPKIKENFEAQLKSTRCVQDLEGIVKKASTPEECELIIKHLNDPSVRRYNGYRLDRYVTMAEERAKQLIGTPTAQLEHNAVAMVGDKATVVRADLVQANPTFTPHTPVAESVSTAVKGVEGTTLTGSYASKAGSVPIQELRTQAYYDQLGAEIEKGVEYFNPRTGNTIRYMNRPYNVTVSKNGVDLMELENTPNGYRRMTRYIADGKDYIHHRNATVDYWCTNRAGMSSWQQQSGHMNWRSAPVSRTPAGSTLDVITKTAGGQEVRITNCGSNPKLVTVNFFEHGIHKSRMNITPEELSKSFGINL